MSEETPLHETLAKPLAERAAARGEVSCSRLTGFRGCGSHGVAFEGLFTRTRLSWREALDATAS
jgi:hypothetical protein